MPASMTANGSAAAGLVATLSNEDFPTDHFTIGPSGLFHIASVSDRR